MITYTLTYPSAKHLSALYGNEPKNLDLAQEYLAISISLLGETITFKGSQVQVDLAIEFFELLDLARSQGLKIQSSDFDKILRSLLKKEGGEIRELFTNPLTLKFKNRTIIPKTINQKHYVQFIYKHDIVFGIGPAGTGKTYLAVAVALQALFENKVERIVLTRPAVEAGEALGFLPGDLNEKILPYLRPLYDAMYDMIGAEDTQKLIEKGVIEIAPLAYMRGRTLSNAYILLDEAQNTSNEQMMMFLTRLGDNSRMIITGDITQIDLPKNKSSGLKQAVQILNKIEGIKLFYFESTDIVRHPLVQKIIEAYDYYVEN